MLKFCVLSLFFVLIGAMGFAASDSDRGPARIPDAGDEPVPVKIHFDFEDGKALWDQSRMPADQALIGEWKLIGFAAVSENFAGLKNFWHPEGHRNQDGSLRWLKMGWQENSITSERLFYVEFRNNGADGWRQGPFRATFNDSQKSLQMARYGYDNLQWTKSYFRLDCRISVHREDQLVCAETLNLDLSEMKIFAPSGPYNHVLGGIEIFEKMAPEPACPGKPVKP